MAIGIQATRLKTLRILRFIATISRTLEAVTRADKMKASKASRFWTPENDGENQISEEAPNAKKARRGHNASVPRCLGLITQRQPAIAVHTPPHAPSAVIGPKATSRSMPENELTTIALMQKISTRIFRCHPGCAITRPKAIAASNGVAQRRICDEPTRRSTIIVPVSPAESSPHFIFSAFFNVIFTFAGVNFR
jgi:hypothetical protein